MSKEEMIDILKGLVFGTFDRTTAKEREALDMAIKALEEPKTGHWYRHSWEICFTCSNCGTTNASGTKYNYCPNCGARMVEPQESEVHDADSD